MFEIYKKIPHSLGPLGPFQLLVQFHRIYVQIQYFTLFFLNTKGQFQLFRVLDVLDFLDMLSQVGHLPQETFHQCPKYLLITGNTPIIDPKANRIVSITIPQQDLRKMPLYPDILDPCISYSVFQDQIVVGEQEMSYACICLLPVYLELLGSLPDHQTVYLGVTVLDFYFEECVGYVAAGKCVQGFFLDFPLVFCYKSLLFQLQCPFLKFVHIQPKFLLFLLQDKYFLLQLLTLGLSLPELIIYLVLSLFQSIDFQLQVNSFTIKAIFAQIFHISLTDGSLKLFLIDKLFLQFFDFLLLTYQQLLQALITVILVRFLDTYYNSLVTISDLVLEDTAIRTFSKGSLILRSEIQ